MDPLHVDRMARWPRPRLQRFLAGLTPQEQDFLDNRWESWRRDDQIAPSGAWHVWLFLAGRGAGKTRAGVEWVRSKIQSGCRRVALIAPTAGDARDVMVEGESGILAHAWEHDRDFDDRLIGRPNYEPSKRRLTWANGAQAMLYSAEEPDRLRGPQHDAMWADELASWKTPNVGDSKRVHAWDMGMFGLRIGSNPQAMVSTTPKPVPVIRELIRQAAGDRPPVVITKATSYDNRKNLAPTFFTQIIRKYEGTRLGRQELMADVLEEAEGALWTRQMVEQARDGRHADYLRVVVAVDPAVTANEMSALTGMVVAGIGQDKRGYVIADLSGRMSPDTWAKRAVDALAVYHADRIVAEGNQGGELVRANIRTVAPNAPIRIVHASRSKQARAEPIAALYEQHKITHLTPFPELDDQLCTWEPLSGDPSPDRLDALVWALTDLMLVPIVQPPVVMPFVTGTPRHIPGQ